MKFHLIVIFVLSLSGATFSQNSPTFTYKISKPYCVFNFLQTAIQHPSSSPSLRRIIEQKTEGDTTFIQLCNRFASIQYNYSYNREEFPERRRQNRYIYDLIINALVQSDNFGDFRSRIIGILPIGETERLISVLKDAERVYDEMIWNENEAFLTSQLKELEKYAGQCSHMFQKISHFYNSEWSPDIPFVVTLYPIPGVRGATTATPHANNLCVGVLTGETDYIGRTGVVLHEMNHVLYDEQSAAFQYELDGYFQQNTSPYSPFAYAFFDEALATALGNGWAYKQLSGELDSTQWYNNEIINGFGKALYPLVEEYLGQGKQMDQLFIDKSIAIFEKTFPSSITNYEVLLNNLFFYINSESYPTIREQINSLGRNFQFSRIQTSSPMTDPISIDLMKTAEGTHLILIDEYQQQTLKTLKTIFPELKNVKLKSSSVIGFSNNKNQTIIILYALNKSDIQELYDRIRQQKNYDPSKLIQFRL